VFGRTSKLHVVRIYFILLLLLTIQLIFNSTDVPEDQKSDKSRFIMYCAYCFHQNAWDWSFGLNNQKDHILYSKTCRFWLERNNRQQFKELYDEQKSKRMKGSSRSDSPAENGEEILQDNTTVRVPDFAQTSTASVSTSRPKIQAQLFQSKSGNVSSHNPMYSHLKMRGAICEGIVMDSKSFESATDEGFARIMRMAQSEYVLMAPGTVKTDIVSRIFPIIEAQIMKRIEREVTTHTKMSFTTDIWSCSHQKKS